VRWRNWTKEWFAEASPGCGIFVLESWRSNSWNHSVRSGIAISVEAEGCQVSYAFQLEVPISVGMHRLIVCLLRKWSMIVLFWV